MTNSDELREQIDEITENWYQQSREQLNNKILTLITTRDREAIKKVKSDVEKVSSAHELYSGSIDAPSFRVGWGMALANLEAQLNNDKEEL